jgi:hypothetical protein
MSALACEDWDRAPACGNIACTATLLTCVIFALFVLQRIMIIDGAMGTVIQQYKLEVRDFFVPSFKHLALRAAIAQARVGRVGEFHET